MLTMGIDSGSAMTKAVLFDGQEIVDFRMEPSGSTPGRVIHRLYEELRTPDTAFVVATGYGRALLLYYPLCFIYIFTAFPLFAWFGGGKGAVGIMFKHIARPAVVSLGTCSSVATIPTNMEEAVETGVSKDIAGMVLPLGATMHMDGSCFSCVLKIAFVLGVFGEQLSWSRLPFIVLVAVLSSVGMLSLIHI